MGSFVCVFLMDEGKIFVNEGKVLGSFWNYLLFFWGVSDEFNWVEKNSCRC